MRIYDEDSVTYSVHLQLSITREELQRTKGMLDFDRYLEFQSVCD